MRDSEDVNWSIPAIQDDGYRYIGNVFNGADWGAVAQELATLVRSGRVIQPTDWEKDVPDIKISDWYDTDEEEDEVEEDEVVNEEVEEPTEEMTQEDLTDQISGHRDMTEAMKETEEYMSAEHMEKMHEIMETIGQQSDDNKKNIKKILLKMTELKFDSDNTFVGDFEFIKDQLELL